MNRLKQPKKDPRKKQGDRRKPVQTLKPAEALDAVETKEAAAERIRVAAILEIIKKVNDFVRERAGGISVPHNAAFNSIWKEKSYFSKHMYRDYVVHTKAIEYIKEDKFTANISKAYGCILDRAREADKVKGNPLSDSEKIAYRKEVKQHFLLDADKVCSLTDLFLSSGYTRPLGSAGLMREILQLNICYYDYFLPRLDRVYPLFNMKLDAAFAALSFTVVRQIGFIKNKGKRKDQTKDATENKKEKARERTEAIADLVKRIASEKDKAKKVKLTADAMNLGGYTNSRAIENRVKAYKESERKKE